MFVLSALVEHARERRLHALMRRKIRKMARTMHHLLNRRMLTT